LATIETVASIGTGVAGGFAGGLAASGGDVKAAAQGALTGGVFGGIGAYFPGGGAGSYAAHAAAGCASAALQGGDCARGAASQLVSKFATIETREWGAGVGQFAVAVVAGGTVSAITGGKFENGAYTAAFGYLFNAAAHAPTFPGSAGGFLEGLGNFLRGGIWLLPLSLSGDAELTNKYYYLTYTRVDAEGNVYSGRTGGYGDPASIAGERASGERDLTALGFGPPQVDQVSSSYHAIRGREQQLIDYHGGAVSVGGSSANLINGVSDWNPNRPIYMNQARRLFGSLPDNSPPRPRFGG
jgi:hypothetical protein